MGALLRFDVLRALDHNLLWAIAAPLVGYALLVWIAASFGVRLPHPDLASKPWLVWVGVVVILGFWLARDVGGADAWISSGVR